MAERKHTDQEILDAVQTYGSYSAAARALGVDPRGVSNRAKRIACSQASLVFPPPAASASSPAVISLPVTDGMVIIGSDAHYWPGSPSAAHSAFVRTIRELEPHTVILNGDVFDGAAVSKHTSIGWEKRPTVAEELAVCQERLAEIVAAGPPGTELIWTMGNHDMRYETFLANNAPEYRNVTGIHLKDHFPAWRPAWRVNFGNICAVQHRWKGGNGAGRNNTLASGRSFITGHDHQLQVTPFTDLNGTRWGVQGGTLAVPFGPQFINYTETTPVNWRSGFVVLTFLDGRLLEPEVVAVVSEKERLTAFRGQISQEVE